MPAQDQIIDAMMAPALQVDAIRGHPLMAWIVTRDEANGPGVFVARLVTDAATPPLRVAGRHAGGLTRPASSRPDAD